MYEHVYECIQAGLTMLDDMNNDLESLYESDISLTPPLIINGLTALTFLEDLSHYFRLTSYFFTSISTWYNIPDFVKLLPTTINLSTNILKVRRNNPILIARFNIYLNFY